MYNCQFEINFIINIYRKMNPLEQDPISHAERLYEQWTFYMFTSFDTHHKKPTAFRKRSLVFDYLWYQNKVTSIHVRF